MINIKVMENNVVMWLEMAKSVQRVERAQHNINVLGIDYYYDTL